MGGKAVAKGFKKGASKGAGKDVKGSGKGKGKGKGTSTAAPVQKSWVKVAAAATSQAWTKKTEPAKAIGKGASAAKGKGKGKGSSEASGKGSGKGKGKGKGKDKGKGKGKGKRKGAAPKNAQFWVRKMEEENRIVMDSDPLTGICSIYNFKKGFGYIIPDDVDSLPQEVRDKMAEDVEAAKAEGKEVKDENRIYFRKPDVERDFRIKEDSWVTFKVYMDDKGVGACEVCDAGGNDEGADAAAPAEEEAVVEEMEA